jgi:predicted nucleic acid-binding protein
MSEWARTSLRAALRADACRTADRKLAAIQRAAEVNGPTADIDRMLDEIAGRARRSFEPSQRALVVMERHGIDRILSFDRDFDRVPGIVRVPR